jgi:hypothetical protein
VARDRSQPKEKRTGSKFIYYASKRENLFTTQAKENTLVKNIISMTFRKKSVPRHKPYPNMYLDKEAACWT